MDSFNQPQIMEIRFLRTHIFKVNRILEYHISNIAYFHLPAWTVGRGVVQYIYITFYLPIGTINFQKTVTYVSSQRRLARKNKRTRSAENVVVETLHEGQQTARTIQHKLLRYYL